MHVLAHHITSSGALSLMIRSGVQMDLQMCVISRDVEWNFEMAAVPRLQSKSQTESFFRRVALGQGWIYVCVDYQRKNSVEIVFLKLEK